MSVHRIVALLLAGLSPTVATASPANASLAPAASTTPASPAPDAPVGSLSRGGTDRGTLEFALAGSTGVVASAMVVRGVWEIRRGQVEKRWCNANDGDSEECFLDPWQLNYTAAILNFAVAIPVAVAAGLLLRRALRVNRDHRDFHVRTPITMGAWANGRRGGGVILSWRL